MNKYIKFESLLGAYMKDLIRYTVVASISFSLIMLSLGSVPQTFAGPPPLTIPSTMSILPSCGLSVANSANFGTVSIGGTIFNSDVIISNSGTSLARISANVGTPLVQSSLAGGYAGVTDQTTHIPPRQITLQIDGQGRVPMFDSGTNALIGDLRNTDPGVFEIGVNMNPINLPTNDPVWVATFDLTVSNCLV